MAKYKYNLSELYTQKLDLYLIGYHSDNIDENFLYLINKSHKFSDVEKHLYILGFANYRMEVVYAEKSFEEWESELISEMSDEDKQYYYYNDMQWLSKKYFEWKQIKEAHEIQLKEAIENSDIAELCDFLESRQQYWKNEGNKKETDRTRVMPAYQEKITAFALETAKAKIKS